MLCTFPSKGSFQPHNNVFSHLVLAFLVLPRLLCCPWRAMPPKRQCSSDKDAAAAYTSPCDLKMPLPTLPEIDEEIRRVTLLTALHKELARNAEASKGSHI